MNLRFGIIGYGFMGHEHMTLLSDFDGIDVIAICDREADQMNDAPEGVAKYTDAADLLARDDIDVVIISANNNQHLKLVKMAAAAKKNIICEKPVALSIPDLEEMEKAVAENGVKFTVHQQRRFDPDYRTMKNVFDSDELGDIYTVQTGLYGYNGNMHDWHVYPEMGGGMLYDWGVHLIDQMLDMVKSEIVSLYADVRNVINENVDDYFNIIMKFKNGVTAEIELGTYYLTPKRAWFIGGNKGSAIIDGFNGEGKIVRTAHLLENVPGKITMTAAGPTRSFGPAAPGLLQEEPLPEVDVNHRNYFEHFLKAFNKEEEVVVKPEQVRRVLCVMDAVRESAKTGKAIAFEA